jgi:acetoin utilization protein AcuB
MTAEQIMTGDPITITERASLAEVMEILSEREVRHLPVIRDGEVVGIISDRDVRSLGLSMAMDIENMMRSKPLLAMTASSVMSSDVVLAERDTSAGDIVELILSEKVGAIPVVDTDTNCLVGIVSYTDILREMKSELD